MVTKKGPKVQKVTKPVATQCSEEINEILTKHNCSIVCQPQVIHGQQVYFPIIVENPKQE